MTSVVSKMGILGQTSNYHIIPDYASEYKNEYLFIRGIDKTCENLNIYIEDTMMRLKNKSYEENWGKIIIYKMILNLVNFIIEYFNNPAEDGLKIVDWYFIDLIINKDKIIIRGFFYELGLFIEDKVLSEGLLELESRINEMNDI